MQTSLGEKVTRLENAVAAGTADEASASVDMANFEGVKFYVAFGAITSGAVTKVQVQQSDDNGSSDTFSTLAGGEVTVADDDDNQVVVIDVYRPRKRYLRVNVDRGTQNAVIDGVLGVQYGARKKPVDNDATTVVSRTVLTSPEEA